MHRVVNMTSVGKDADIISDHKEEIRTQLDNYDQDNIFDREVNDGYSQFDNPTFGANVDFNNDTDANSFHDRLKQYITDNSDDFISARTRVYDCYHADGKKLPC